MPHRLRQSRFKGSAAFSVQACPFRWHRCLAPFRSLLGKNFDELRQRHGLGDVAEAGIIPLRAILHFYRVTCRIAKNSTFGVLP